MVDVADTEATCCGPVGASPSDAIAALTEKLLTPLRSIQDWHPETDYPQLSMPIPRAEPTPR